MIIKYHFLLNGVKMKILYKFFITFLFFSFFSLQAMDLEQTDSNNPVKRRKKKEKRTQIFEPYNLKTICILKILPLIKSLNIEDYSLATLPKDLLRDIRVFNHINEHVKKYIGNIVEDNSSYIPKEKKTKFQNLLGKKLINFSIN